MKIRLSIILLFCAGVFSAQARSFPSYDMYLLAMISDTVIYCDETEITPAAYTKCKVLQAFKGDLAPGAELTIYYNRTFDGKTFPPGRSLLFLRKGDSGSYKILWVKYVQGGKIYELIEGGKIGTRGWENLMLPDDHAYGEKELLDDLAIAVKNASHKKAMSKPDSEYYWRELETVQQ